MAPNDDPPIPPGDFNAGEPDIEEGTYTVSFSGTDPAGNTALTLINNYTYDTTAPTGDISFSQSVASVGTIVTVFGTFDENITESPQITLDLPDITDDIDLTDMYIWGSCDCLNDSTVPTSTSSSFSFSVIAKTFCLFSINFSIPSVS